MSHQPYTGYYANELPERHRALVDVRRFGPGERFIFEPYTQAMYEHTQAWINGIFPNDQSVPARYGDAVIGRRRSYRIPVIESTCPATAPAPTVVSSRTT